MISDVASPEDALFVLESCHSTWIFDTESMHYRRIPKGIAVEDQSVATMWRPYFALHVTEGSEAFTVALNAEGSRLIRSWRHTKDCAQCGSQVTSELSRRDIQSALD
jgi:hypothetical protein